MSDIPPAGWLKLNNPLTHVGNTHLPVYQCDICYSLTTDNDAHYDAAHRGATND